MVRRTLIVLAVVLAVFALVASYWTGNLGQLGLQRIIIMASNNSMYTISGSRAAALRSLLTSVAE
ncbi:hypothetical protein [Paenibacillus sp. 1P07SE]|uniref:hypothetical protein n=1 Tax=Paenibacillus sp. 1P07SE TaxID=3132209 RepID=UPI0039A71DEC